MKPPGIIALLTDYGLHDHYVGVLKGAILSANPRARIVDVAHEIPPQDVREGARLLAAAAPYFPAGTIFVAVVDPGVGSDREIVGVETDRHFFLAPDNGLLGGLERVRRAVRIRETKYFLRPLSRTFHGRDIFAPVAGHLSRGVDLSRFGPPAGKLATLEIAGPKTSRGGSLEGEVVAIDRFGNLITNIREASLPRRADARVRVGSRTVRKLSRTYADARKGELLALVGSTGHLEISVNQGSAARSARIRKGDRVLVTPARP